jgi:hypothetical protein
MKAKTPPCPGPGYRLVFSRTIRLRTGKVLIAANYGLKAFAFWVKD